MNCEEYEILLSARLDGALTPGGDGPAGGPPGPVPPVPAAGPGAGNPPGPNGRPDPGGAPCPPGEPGGPGLVPGPPDGDRPFQKEETSAALGRLRRDRRRPDGFGFTHLALPGAAAACPRASPPFSPCRGPGGEHRHRRGTAPSPPTPRKRPPTRPTAPPPPDDGAAEGDTNAPSDSAGEGNKDDGNTATDTPPIPPTKTLAASRRTPAMTRDKTTPPTGRIPPQTLACPRRRPSPSSSPTWPSRGGPWS